MGILTERRTPTNHRRFDRVEVESLLKQNNNREKE